MLDSYKVGMYVATYIYNNYDKYSSWQYIFQYHDILLDDVLWMSLKVEIS